MEFLDFDLNHQEDIDPFSNAVEAISVLRKFINEFHDNGKISKIEYETLSNHLEELVKAIYEKKPGLIDYLISMLLEIDGVVDSNVSIELTHILCGLVNRLHKGDKS
jgi:hypothetical protein